MKCLSIDNEYYLYPSGIDDIDAFANFIENNDKKFIKLKKLFEKNCVTPYFVFEEISDVFLSINGISEFFEQEVVILEKCEYDKMLENLKKKLCFKCDQKEDCFNNEKVLRENLCLDGTCECFCEE